MAAPYYAHSAEGGGEWQLLSEHLANVAKGARERAEAAGGDAAFIAFAEAAGWLHDLGKYRDSFQNYIRGIPPLGSKGHKHAGAAWAVEQKNAEVAIAILGHHGGLTEIDECKSLKIHPDGFPVLCEVRPRFTDDTLFHFATPFPSISGSTVNRELLARMIFSCLVDADWSDTRAHEIRWKKLEPDPLPPPLDPQVRCNRVLEFISSKAEQLRSRNPRLAAVRESILHACLAAAERPPGLFTLTVPTGGGKTLSGLAFALKNAAAHRLRRVIYVAPYLSILDQNVQVMRDALGLTAGDPDLFEHHSLAEPPGNNADETASSAAARRAENWDAPIIVTTNVQFFESFFSNKPGQCRKLHNIAKSVILLDECQTLPAGLVMPTCQMLKQVVEKLGCTIVLCTATQPAFDHQTLNEHRLAAHEIIPADLNLFEQLKRVTLHWPNNRDERLDWPAVADRMTKHPAALGVVNTKAAARDLFGQLKSVAPCGAVFHLSTSMCPAHRLGVLALIRQRLRDSLPVFVASTQLIEAGVDLDFPAVFREMAPLESIIQAAGRCNREGLLNGLGHVEIFRSVEGKLPQAWYTMGRDIVESVFLANDRKPEIDNAADIRDYFQHLYWSGNLDPKNIIGLRNGWKFADCAKDYRLIRDDGVPVVVATWSERKDEIESLLETARRTRTRAAFRKLAPFQVNLRRYEISKLSRNIVQADADLDLFVWYGEYDSELGLKSELVDQLLLV